MGADLCLNILVWDEDKTLDWDAGRKTLEEYARTVWKEENPDREPTEEELDTTILDDGMAYSMIKSALTELELCFKSGFIRRDVNVIQFPPYYILIAGGESWGESPSEMYDILQDIFATNTEPSLCEVIGFEISPVNYKAIVEKILQAKNVCPLLLGIDPVLDEMIAGRLKKCSSKDV